MDYTGSAVPALSSPKFMPTCWYGNVGRMRKRHSPDPVEALLGNSPNIGVFPTLF